MLFVCSCPKHQIAAFLSPPKQTDAYTSNVHQEMSGATHVPFKGLQIGPHKDPWELFAYEKPYTLWEGMCSWLELYLKQTQMALNTLNSASGYRLNTVS